MRKGYVFGSSTPRELSHHKTREKSSVLEALASDGAHDVRPYMRSMHNTNCKSMTCA